MDRLTVSVPSSPTNGRSRSINCGLDPETGRLRFFNSAFKSLTFISSRRVRVLVVVTVAGSFACQELGAGEVAAVDGPVDTALTERMEAKFVPGSPKVLVDGLLLGALAGSMICGYLCCHSNCH